MVLCKASAGRHDLRDRDAHIDAGSVGALGIKHQRASNLAEYPSVWRKTHVIEGPDDEGVPGVDVVSASAHGCDIARAWSNRGSLGNHDGRKSHEPSKQDTMHAKCLLKLGEDLATAIGALLRFGSHDSRGHNTVTHQTEHRWAKPTATSAGAQTYASWMSAFRPKRTLAVVIAEKLADIAIPPGSSPGDWLWSRRGGRSG